MLPILNRFLTHLLSFISNRTTYWHKSIFKNNSVTHFLGLTSIMTKSYLLRFITHFLSLVAFRNNFIAEGWVLTALSKISWVLWNQGKILMLEYKHFLIRKRLYITPFSRLAVSHTLSLILIRNISYYKR